MVLIGERLRECRDDLAQQIKYKVSHHSMQKMVIECEAMKLRIFVLVDNLVTQ